MQTSSSRSRYLKFASNQRLLVAPAAVVLLLLAGCAGKAEPEVLATESPEIAAARLTTAEVTELRGQIDTLQKRLTTLEASAKRDQSQLAELDAAVKELKKNKAPALIINGKPITAEEREEFAKKIARLEESVRKAKTGGSNHSEAAPAGAPSPVIRMSAGDENDEKNRYTASYLAVKSGRYDDAISGFTVLLGDYPNGQFSDQAYYWLGEAYFSQKKLEAARSAFQKVVERYTGSPKYTAALLKLALSNLSIGQIEDAIRLFNRLVADYPNTPESESAKKQLDALK